MGILVDFLETFQDTWGLMGSMDFLCIISLQRFSPFTLICPHPDPQLRRLDSKSRRDTLLCEQQWRPFSLMWGAHGKSTRGLLPFTELAWQWNQNQDHFTLYLWKKSVVFLLGLQVWVPGPSSSDVTQLCTDFSSDFYVRLPKWPIAANVSLQSYLSKV